MNNINLGSKDTSLIRVLQVHFMAGLNLLWVVLSVCL